MQFHGPYMPSSDPFVQWLTPDGPTPLTPYVLHYGYEESFHTFYWEMFKYEPGGEVASWHGDQINPIDNPRIVAREISVLAGMTPDRQDQVARAMTERFATTLTANAGGFSERLPDPGTYQGLARVDPVTARITWHNVWARVHAADEMRSLIPGLDLDSQTSVDAFWNHYERRISVHEQNVPILGSYGLPESAEVELDNTLTQGDSNAAGYGY